MKNVFMVPNHERKGDHYVNHVCPNYRTSFDSKEMGRKISCSFKTKVSTSFIPMMSNCLWCLSEKSWLLPISKFFPVEAQTLILRKMVVRKVFLVKPKHHC